jgi:formylglycine-generating enzyme required for sulfatase activity
VAGATVTRWTGREAALLRTAMRLSGREFAGLATHPVVYVTWHDANAYARWAGKTLPTAQQWEKAARGPQGRSYPWGDEPTAAKCNVAEAGIGATTPVFRYQSGVSPYGAVDMCGNVWEWTTTEAAPPTPAGTS